MTTEAFFVILYYSTGKYVPVTEGGNVVVNGVLASCYATANHDIVHFAMMPLQLFPEVIKLVFGNYNGSPTYVGIAKDFAKMIPFFKVNI